MTLWRKNSENLESDISLNSDNSSEESKFKFNAFNITNIINNISCKKDIDKLILTLCKENIQNI